MQRQSAKVSENSQDLARIKVVIPEGILDFIQADFFVVDKFLLIADDLVKSFEFVCGSQIYIGIKLAWLCFKVKVFLSKSQIMMHNSHKEDWILIAFDHLELNNRYS